MEKPFEIIPDSVSRNDLIDESNRRSAKAGYANRQGEPLYATRIQTVVSLGQTKLNVWPRDLVTGKLIDD